MKVWLFIISVCILMVVIVFFYLGKASQSGGAMGLIENRLAKCATNPNCVCSEYKKDIEHYVEAIKLPEQTGIDHLSIVKQVIQEMGGRVEKETENYLAAIFTSDFFKFVDDVEIRVDTDNQLIQIRSASRVGYSDAKVNKKRMERLKRLFKEKLK